MFFCAVIVFFFFCFSFFSFLAASLYLFTVDYYILWAFRKSTHENQNKKKTDARAEKHLGPEEDGDFILHFVACWICLSATFALLHDGIFFIYF